MIDGSLIELLTNPMNAVIVEVVEDGQAVLVSASLLQLTVVWLGNANSSIF